MPAVLDETDLDGLFLGRVWNAAETGPSVVTLRDGLVIDITSREAPMVRDVCELDDPSDYVRSAPGAPLGTLAEISDAPVGNLNHTHLLAPCDLQAIKACGVTFANSMVERVIEEQAAGDPRKAEGVRTRVAVGGARSGGKTTLEPHF